MQRLAGRLWPGGPHPGGLGWELAIDQSYPELHLGFGGDEVVGWAGRSDGRVEVHADPNIAGAARDLLGWALNTGWDGPVSVPVFDADTVFRDEVAAVGFRPDRGNAPIYGMFHYAIPEAPPVPDGYRIRGLAEGEEHARVEAHRAAWCPATLPLPPDVLATVSQDATSRFTHDHFAAVQKAWLYDPALDLVVEATDGSLVGCCTLWWDPNLGVAEIEPLGVVPEHRRRGLAGALCLHAAALVGARGGSQVFINTGPLQDYPAPAATYTATGFSTVTRGQTWTRPAH